MSNALISVESLEAIASDLSTIAPDQRLYKKDCTKPGLQSVKPIKYSVIMDGSRSIL